MYHVSFAARCPSQVGFPIVDLPHKRVEELYLLPQVSFPCPGTLDSFSVYGHFAVNNVHLGVARWLDDMKTHLQIVHIFGYMGVTSGAGKQTFDITGNKAVEDGDFLVIISDLESPASLSYSIPNDPEHDGNELDLVMVNGGIMADSVEEGLIYNITDPGWRQDRKTFALYITLRNNAMLEDVGKGIQI